MKIIKAVVEEDGVKARRYAVLEDRICVNCGQEFSPKHQLSNCCSRKCSKAYNAKKPEQLQKSRERASRWSRENSEVAREKRKAAYWANPEKFRAKAKEYRDAHREEKRTRDQAYKDRIRHGGLRKKLIEENGLVCARCGIQTSSDNLDGHHTTWNNQIHEHQELLCKSCHAKEHGLGKTIGRYSALLKL